MSASSEDHGSVNAGQADHVLPQGQGNAAVGSKKEGMLKGVLEDGDEDNTYPGTPISILSGPV